MRGEAAAGCSCPGARRLQLSTTFQPLCLTGVISSHVQGAEWVKGDPTTKQCALARAGTSGRVEQLQAGLQGKSMEQTAPGGSR